METGKIPETVLKRSILKQIRHRRPEVLFGPGVGEDCCGLLLEPGEAVVMSTDPITGAQSGAGTLAVHITANDIAAGGAELIGILLSVILPPGTGEEELKKLMGEVESACEGLDAEILGGHTEISPAVNQPLITVTGVGKAKKDRVISTAGLKPGQDLVMTKWAGLEGTAILAADRGDVLSARYSKQYLKEAASFMDSISIVKEARIAAEFGASAMHDMTEGGVFGALWEMAGASRVGLEADLKKIPIKQETVEICDFFDINPYMLISSGCLLIGADRGEELVKALAEEGIPSAVIGCATDGNDRLLHNGEEIRYLEPPKSDELYKALARDAGTLRKGTL